MMEASQIKPHMPVVCSENGQFAVVDHMEGKDTIKLTKDDKGQPQASVFYVAYTEDGVAPKSRPITFLYNGGPGSATIWLHMGSVGPIRVVTRSPQASGPAPFEWVQNEYSLLDKTDLVFIDAPLCGFSRAVGKGTAKDFAGVFALRHGVVEFEAP